MTAQIAPLVASIPTEELGAVIDGLYALYRVREYSELNRNSFLKELIEGLRPHADPPIEDSELPEITSRFRRLLKIETLESISKAVTVQRDGERLYCGSRILTDMRPVFGREDDSELKAAVITHNLRISYHDCGEHKDVYFVMDEEDLAEIHGVIERALAKTQTIDGFLDKVNLPRLGI
jgi:hypothetical protein